MPSMIPNNNSILNISNINQQLSQQSDNSNTNLAYMPIYIAIGSVLISICLILIYFKIKTKKNRIVLKEEISKENEYAEPDIIKNMYDELEKDLPENEYSNPILIENYYEQADEQKTENQYEEPTPIENFYDEAD